MPIFEYVCRKCGHQFEALVQNSNTVECPSCQSRKLEKQLSVFSAGTKGQPMRDISPGPCGTCGDPRGPGSCSMN
jgi:putative FmdB family regulatory protein